MNTITCPRCGGTGLVPRFAHYAKGLCFRCSGAGEIKVRIHRDGSQDHDHVIGWPIEDRCVRPGCGLPISDWPPTVTGKWWANGVLAVYVQYYGVRHAESGELFRVEADTKRKAQNVARRQILEALPNARIKWSRS